MRRLGPVLIVSLLVVTLAAPAFAGTSTLTLKRATLTNVADAAGSWQFEGGTVLRGKTQVGHYAAHRRVVNGGTNTLNTSMYTATLFLTGGNGPTRNVTMQGAWNFGPGTAIGGVSAASPPYQFLQHDGTFSATAAAGGITTLVINWTGGGAVP